MIMQCMGGGGWGVGEWVGGMKVLVSYRYPPLLETSRSTAFNGENIDYVIGIGNSSREP